MVSILLVEHKLPEGAVTVKAAVTPAEAALGLKVNCAALTAHLPAEVTRKSTCVKPASVYERVGTCNVVSLPVPP